MSRNLHLTRQYCVRLTVVVGIATCQLALSGPVNAQQDAITRDDPFTPTRNAVVTAGGCTGTLIDDQIVLTAAHCLKSDVRAARPDGQAPIACAGLSEQGVIQDAVWEDPSIWYPAQPGMKVWAGNTRERMRLAREVTAYALPRCGDVALVRLDLAFPRYVAVPLPVMTTPPADVDRLLTLAALRHAGWGVRILGKADQRRQTGPARYWGFTRCHLIALPPRRDADIRVLKGDSGSPLLFPLGETEVVIGVLWGFGRIDFETCGTTIPAAPKYHGSYTPTWRPAIPSTPATDIGAWLREMVPNATHVTAPE